MKKILVLFSALLLTLSACAEDISLVTPQIEAPVEQTQMITAQDYQAGDTVNSNKESVSAIAESLFAQNFADDLDITAVNKVSSAASTLEQKGGMIFSLLNKSKFVQNVGYLISDYPVRAYFNKKGKSDSTPRINQQQIDELLSVLKPGDLILCGNNSSFVHAILYLGNGVIVHSLATKGIGNNKFLGVVKETISEYLFRAERDKFVVLRYKNLDPNEFTKTVEYANKQVGKSYDTLFLMNSDSRFYCTELVYQSLKQMGNAPRMMPHKVKLGWQLITNEDLMDSPDFETVWNLNKERPQTGKLHSYN